MSSAPARYPPPGSGVGAVAEAAPDLTFEEEHAKYMETDLQP